MTDKLYYSIGEVAEMLQVAPSLLRFWETEFKEIQPHKNAKGTRFYTQADIDILKRIHHLTRNCGYTLEGAKEQLRYTDDTDAQLQLVQTLTDAKKFLLELKEQL